MERFPNFEQYQASASYAQIGEHKIAYWTAQDAVAVENDEPWVLLIHGFPSAAWDWHNQWHVLRQKYRLVCLDLLGFGLSDKPNKHDYSLLEQADILEVLLAQLHIKRCHILAHDYGDSVAQELLTRHAEKRSNLSIQSVCYLNGGLFADCHRPLLTQKLLKSPLGPLMARFMSQSSLHRSFAKIFGPSSPPDAAHIAILYALLEWKQGKRVLPHLLKYIDERKAQASRWINAMQHTSVPQCFINGVHDPISGQHMLNQFEHLLPHAQTYALQVGHYPQLEAPKEVTALYLAFVNHLG
ncbi:MAG: alpha/beta hydrolase [Alteromonadaceae bacterium]|uniref:alpha/beta fold hydrolase n=1 Tax=Paraglaciecola chathamensis TaxID=368405 RepID=UPI000C5AE3E3|nr:alpha/beta hydrolase [Paraglaciecola agarilytica]MBN25872.1 alpha/beta hydrolase [Alteromonadaceae bacterium]|tara:strand:+ start:18605 stop:19498 length:894 start_codon:yes stop_codon:yes gene_type:complete